MSFGFSAGDFIAATKLICEIKTCLESAGGARSDYQELLREFECLDAALRHLDKLENNSSQTSTCLNALKCTALSCRVPLEAFLKKMRRYENSLGIWKKAALLKTTKDQVEWTFKLKDEMKRLQMYLNVHVGTINILLAEYGLERMDIAMKSRNKESAQIQSQLQDNQVVLDEVRRDLPAQRALLRMISSMIEVMHKFVSGEVKTSLDHIGHMVERFCVSTQQIYTVVLEIRDSINIADTRWTYFQAPLVVEDALGYKFPIPSEYDYAMIQTIICHRFQTGTWSDLVNAGEWELRKANRRSEIMTPSSRLSPGTALVMAIIMPQTTKSHIMGDAFCPMASCIFSKGIKHPAGGYTCSECDAWFNIAPPDMRWKSRGGGIEITVPKDKDCLRNIQCYNMYIVSTVSNNTVYYGGYLTADGFESFCKGLRGDRGT